jgi:hypothetical protein
MSPWELGLTAGILIAAMLAYYLYFARLIGAIATAWRPIRGLEARPAYWIFGYAFIYLIFAGHFLLFRAFPEGLILAGLSTGVFGLAAFWWWRRRIWLDDDAVWGIGEWRGMGKIPVSALSRVRLDEARGLLWFETDGPGLPIKAGLSMDGLDGIYAALVRRGVPGLDWEAFQTLRRQARRR